MPYATIYKLKDKKWHLPDCELFHYDVFVLESIKIGGQGNSPDPPKNDMCPICFHFLFDNDD